MKNERRQVQFENDADFKRNVNTAVRDAFFHMVIIVLSFLAIAGIGWVTFNGEIVDLYCRNFLKP
jgi:hypothetical protein